jgi:hypothetical protein
VHTSILPWAVTDFAFELPLRFSAMCPRAGCRVLNPYFDDRYRGSAAKAGGRERTQPPRKSGKWSVLWMQWNTQKHLSVGLGRLIGAQRTTTTNDNRWVRHWWLNRRFKVPRRDVHAWFRANHPVHTTHCQCAACRVS